MMITQTVMPKRWKLQKYIVSVLVESRYFLQFPVYLTPNDPDLRNLGSGLFPARCAITGCRMATTVRLLRPSLA